MKFIYSLYDQKAKTSLGLMTFENADVAVRALQSQFQNNPNVPIFEFPDDYTLYELGVFDGENLKLETTEPCSIGSVRFLIQNSPAAPDDEGEE